MTSIGEIFDHIEGGYKVRATDQNEVNKLKIVHKVKATDQNEVNKVKIVHKVKATD